jgi:hypothetical protein
MYLLQALVKRLMARKRFVPWGGNKEFKTPAMPLLPSLAPVEEPPEEVGHPFAADAHWQFSLC